MPSIAISAAAAATGIPARTIRSWVQDGKLAAEHGRRGKVVDLDLVRELAGSAADGGNPGSERQTRRQVAAEDGIPEMAAIIAKLTDQNVELAGRVGFLMARNQDLEAQVKLLAAPAPIEPETFAQPVESTATARPWWAFWRRPADSTTTV